MDRTAPWFRKNFGRTDREKFLAADHLAQAERRRKSAEEELRAAADAAFQAASEFQDAEFAVDTYEWFDRTVTGEESTSLAEAEMYVDLAARAVPAFAAAGGAVLREDIGAFHAGNAAYYLALAIRGILENEEKRFTLTAFIRSRPEDPMPFNAARHTPATRAFVALSIASAAAALAHAPEEED
jgi:hypothetical protein